jgi:hypothetical protein
MKSSLVRASAAAVILVTAAGVAAFGPKKAPEPPPVIQAPPPPPSTSLATSVVAAAAAYEDYLHQATVLGTRFSDPAQVQSELKTGESFQPTQLAHGAIAYAAIVALQDPDFVAAVKAHAQDAAGRQQLVNLIFSDPRYAAQLPGAQSAAVRIQQHLNADGMALQTTGAAIKQSAYDVQHQAWSKTIVADRDGRLALAKQLGSDAAVPSAAESALLMQAAVTGTGLDAGAPTVAGGAVSGVGQAAANLSNPIIPAGTAPAAAAAGAPAAAVVPNTEGVNRGLAIAALAVLGAAGDENATQVSALMDDGIGQTCLNLAKMNHYQCLAVAKPHYEDVFCLGQHALMETGRCLQKAVGTAPAETLEITRYEAAAAAKKAGKKAPVHHKGRRHH